MVMENMFGDILSDLGAATVGGMGMAPSADIGARWAVFSALAWIGAGYCRPRQSESGGDDSVCGAHARVVRRSGSGGSRNDRPASGGHGSQRSG